MRRYSHIICVLLLVLSTGLLSAQNNEVTLGIRAGHNASFGGFTAVSAEAHQTLGQRFTVHGGVQYNTIGRTAIEARPSYFHDFSWGRLSAEAFFAYTHLTSVNSYAAGAGAGISGKWISGRLGYYYHIFGGKAGQIMEPFNIFYELSANLLPMIDAWDLKLSITNCEIFELERHYQPTFSATCSYYPSQKIGVQMGVGCKPAGMFNMSADYYESYIKIGVCYRW